MKRYAKNLVERQPPPPPARRGLMSVPAVYTGCRCTTALWAAGAGQPLAEAPLRRPGHLCSTPAGCLTPWPGAPLHSGRLSDARPVHPPDLADQVWVFVSGRGDRRRIWWDILRLTTAAVRRSHLSEPVSAAVSDSQYHCFSPRLECHPRGP